LLALGIECGFKAGHVHRQATLAAHVGGQVDRETKGVGQLEGGRAIEHGLAAGQRRVEQFHAVGERLAKEFFFQLQGVFDMGLTGAQFRIGFTHDFGERGDELVEERAFLAELVAVADSATDDPAQHIAATVIGRQRAIGNQESAGADMVGDDFQRWCGLVVFNAGDLGCGFQQIDEEVDFVVGVHALHDCGNALQTHAGIHRRLGQRVHHAGFVAVELHEHVVPDFDVAIAIFFRRARQAARNMRAVIVENFSTRAARAGVAHGPEVVRCVLGALVVANADYALSGETDFLVPDIEGFVVFGVDRHPELFFGQIEPLRRGQKFPGKEDRVALEVIAKAEIAQHFKEGVVTRGIADVFQIVVLAAGTNALLAGGGAGVSALVKTEEHILELVHARIGEQNRRVVSRDQRGRGHDLVTFLSKEVEEFLANFSGFHGQGSLKNALKARF